MSKFPIQSLIVVGMLLSAVLACSRPGGENIIYVTATFPGGERVLHDSPTPSEPTLIPSQPTPNPTRPISIVASTGAYSVQPGDTLATIASLSGITVQALMEANGILDPNLLEVGQVLIIPDASGNTIYGSALKIIPDSELVYSPAVAGFDVAAYVKLKNGFLRVYSDEVRGEFMSGVEMVDEVARNYSVNPRLLLALLEYKTHWLTETTIDENGMTYPFGFLEAGRIGLYTQLLDAADVLSDGYYGWKYRGFQSITFDDGTSIVLHPGLNPGTAAVQYFFSKYATLEQWKRDVSAEGFFQLYLSMFGDPFLTAFEPVTPFELVQPPFTFPFSANETWYYTGGPHGGYDTGSAWASIDFAPPAPPDSLLAQQGYCYISPFWVAAVAPGVVARSGGGFIILDLDFDGNEHTGWTAVYLHIADDADLVPEGTIVNTGDRLGHPSCTGGFSSATHLHFGRRYNGEWIPVDCYNCPPGVPTVPFIMSGWTVRGYEGQEYQGYMENAAGEFRRAEQGRDDPINELRYDK